MTTDKQALEAYRDAFVSARQQGLLIPTVLGIAEWNDLNRLTIVEVPTLHQIAVSDHDCPEAHQPFSE